MEVFNRPEELKVKDEIGNELIFNSEIDCLNFMVKNGYELISKNERISGESSFPVFLMRKTKLEKKNWFQEYKNLALDKSVFAKMKLIETHFSCSPFMKRLLENLFY